MTDKELKKLRRLELLELLLAESRENERLREELERIKQENTVEESARHLNETSLQLENALQQVSSITSMLDKAVSKENIGSDAPAATSPALSTKQAKHTPEEKKAEPTVDSSIYKNLILFFSKNPHTLYILPDDLRKTITNRIEEIRNKPKA